MQLKVKYVTVLQHSWQLQPIDKKKWKTILC